MSQLSIYERIMNENKGTAGSRRSDEPRTEAPSGRGLRMWIVIVALLVLALVSGAAVAFLKYPSPFLTLGGRAQVTPVATTLEPSLPDSPFLAHAKQAGLEACSTVFPVLGQLLTDGAEFIVQSEWNEKEPDRHPVQALVGLDYSSGQYTGAAAGLVFAAPNGASCEGAMVRVAPFATSCDNVLEKLPKGSTLTRNLGKSSVYTLADNGGQALLLPTGTNCIVVSVARAGAP